MEIIADILIAIIAIITGILMYYIIDPQRKRK